MLALFFKFVKVSRILVTKTDLNGRFLLEDYRGNGAFM